MEKQYFLDELLNELDQADATDAPIKINNSDIMKKDDIK